MFMTQQKLLQPLAFKLVPNPYQYPSGSKRSYSKNGIKLELDISDYIGHYIYFDFPDPSHQTLIDLAKPGATILDVGTNIGGTVLSFACAVGESGKVYGFEPDPLNYKRCLHNLRLNSFKNIEVLNAGLGNEKAKLKLEVRTPENRGGNRIAGSSSPVGEFSVIDVVTMNDFVKEKNISKVDLIKIDVEGFELKVLEGGRRVLQNSKPVLFIELDDNNLKDQGNSAKELISFLKDLGYNKIIHAENNSPVDEHSDFRNCHYDIICYPTR